jgi:hypothetical protein
MYPNSYFSLFPPFPRGNSVFVAMSFDPRFDARWDKVIAPGVARVRLASGQSLDAHRVDLRKTGDSVLTDILQGISSCCAFLADISTIGFLRKRPIRNANVLYEVGLAQAVLPPEQTVLLRSDDDALLFDLMNVRVLRYDPDANPETAKGLVSQAVSQSLRETDLRRSLTVRRIAEMLDVYCLLELIVGSQDGLIRHDSPTINLPRLQRNARRDHAILRLLDLGCLQVEPVKLDPDLLDDQVDQPDEKVAGYRVTLLGHAVMKYAREQMNIDSSDVQEALRLRRVQKETMTRDGPGPTETKAGG